MYGDIMSQVRRFHCLVIGDVKHPELRAAIDWLVENTDADLHLSPATAIESPLSIPPFDLILLAQTRPGQISLEAVESLNRKWPFAIFVQLFGNWCEGESRSGRLLPGVWRMSATSFIARMRDLVGTEGSVRSSMRQLPRLASEAERLFRDASEPLSNASGLVLIAAGGWSAYQPLADAVALAGFAAVWQLPHQEPRATGISVAIWDAARGDEQDWQAIGKFSAAVGPAPVVVLLGFPRPQDFSRADEVSELRHLSTRIMLIAKPFRLSELCRALVGTTGRSVNYPLFTERNNEPGMATAAEATTVSQRRGSAAKSA
jgi:hypothetical protein